MASAKSVSIIVRISPFDYYECFVAVFADTKLSIGESFECLSGIGNFFISAVHVEAGHFET
jgi:hypothetical protein